VDDTPEALLSRNQAAIDQVAAMLPTNANEAILAAQCVAARAQADDVLRLIREHADDELKTVMKLNAQYIAMMRTSQGAHGHLLRAQAMRYKRETSDAALKADEWTQYIVTRSMEQALEAGPAAVVPAGEPAAPASVAEPRVNAPEPMAPAPEPAPAASPLPVASSPPPMSVPAAPWLASPPSRDQSAAQRSSRRMRTPAQPDDPPRDLLADAEYYATVYPRRAREIRRCGGLPPNCSFGPPDGDLVRTLLTNNSAILRALDDTSAAAD
jgi:hypothetical protein